MTEDAQYRAAVESLMRVVDEQLGAARTALIRPLEALADEYEALAERTGNGDLAALVVQMRAVINQQW